MTIRIFIMTVCVSLAGLSLSYASGEYSAITLSLLDNYRGESLRSIRVYPHITEQGAQEGLTRENVCASIMFRGTYKTTYIEFSQNEADVTGYSASARFDGLNEDGACLFDFGDGYTLGVATETDKKFLLLSGERLSQRVTFETDTNGTSTDETGIFSFRQYGYFRWGHIFDRDVETLAEQGEPIRVDVCRSSERSTSCAVPVPYQGVSLRNLPKDTPLGLLTVFPRLSEEAKARGALIEDVCGQLAFIRGYWIDNYGFGFYGYQEVVRGTAPPSGGCVFRFVSPEVLPTSDTYWQKPIEYGIKVLPSDLFTEKDIYFELETGVGKVPDRYLSFERRFIGSPIFYWMPSVTRYLYDPIYFDYTIEKKDADYAVKTITQETNCISECNSSVLFFPGIMGSRLYTKEDTFVCHAGGMPPAAPICESGEQEKELWLSRTEDEHKKLALNEEGRSVDENIYTKTGKSGLMLSTYKMNVYDSFVHDIEALEDEGKIASHSIIPYDWRLSLEDILANGTSTEDGTVTYTRAHNFNDSYIFKELERLADTSKSGKVTIVAHSNGGLLAKALIQKLQDVQSPLYNKIDKVILVAVPQVGTPDALGSILHGTKIGPYGLVMEAQEVRNLLQNMPTGYTLLPSERFFESINPLIEFSSKDTQAIEAYGPTVNTYDEYMRFLRGEEGRATSSERLMDPAVLNRNLLSDAIQRHASLDAWTPPIDTEVYQIAGWGIYTPSGLKYNMYEQCDRFTLSGECTHSQVYRSVSNQMKLNGDGVVLSGSAQYMGETSKVKNYWVDLRGYGKESIFYLGINIPKNTSRVHKDILEVTALRTFLQSILKNQESLPDFISSSEPPISVGEKYTTYEIHSPLYLTATDSAGDITGYSTTTQEIVNQIPGATYNELGEVKSITLPQDIVVTITLTAYSSGSFTFVTKTQEGNIVTKETALESIPTATTTVATLTSRDTTHTLHIDQNGDGVFEKTITLPQEGDTVYTEHTFTPLQQPLAPGASYFFIPNKEKEVIQGSTQVKPKIQEEKKSELKNTQVEVKKNAVTLQKKIPQKSEQKRVKKAEISQHSSSTSTYNTPPKGKEVVEPKEQSKLLQIIKKFIHFFGG